MTRPIPKPLSPAGYFQPYIDRIAESDVALVLAQQIEPSLAWFAKLPETRATHRYAPGKWSIAQVLGHLIDGERIFAYRLLWMARGGPGVLTGFPQDEFVDRGGFDQRPLADLIDEARSVRASTLTLLAGLPELDWSTTAEVSGNQVEMAAIPWILAGHEQHHMEVLR
ncbi:MAG TPA: DinB family protein, partial [Planctomycetota bacterium]|nr:DinB family protein [Planctomycetota bacterium]